MRNRNTIILILFTLVLSGPPAQSFGLATQNHSFEVRRNTTLKGTPRKRALLVGVSKYCRGDGSECGKRKKYWWDLNSEPDLDALKQVLMQKFAFTESEIKVLKTTEETTHESIRRTFKSFLIDQTSEGDTVYFHYSGHGGTVPDDDQHGPNPIVGDEISGYDQTLIPSDYVSRLEAGNDIRDDEIRDWLDELKKKKPGNVTITMDSCFSGTNTRGGRFLVRGSKWEGAPPQPPKSRGSKPTAEDSTGLLPQAYAASLGYVVIAATRNDQLAGETDGFDGKAMGLLSYALAKALMTAGPRTTYRDVFGRIYDEVTRDGHDQNPTIEGEMDKVLMQGIALPPQPFINIGIENENLLLNAGYLQGMTKGSRFDLYAADTKDFKEAAPIASAEIQTVQATSSRLKFVGPAKVDLKQLQNARARETEHKFDDARLRVAFEGIPQPATASDDLATRVKQIDVVRGEFRGSNDWDIKICRGKCTDEKPSSLGDDGNFSSGYTMMRQDGSIIRRVSDEADAFAKISLALKGEARWRFVKNLKNDDPMVKIEMRLIPVSAEERSSLRVGDRRIQVITKTKDLGPPLEVGTLHSLPESSYYLLEIKNTGYADAYINVIDLTSDGHIAPLWPNPVIPLGNADENKIPADGEWHRVPAPFVVTITPPYGPEIFKAIATREPADFSPLLSERSVGTKRGGNDRGAKEEQTALGKLLKTATTIGMTTRGEIEGTQDISSPNADTFGWSTFEFQFVAITKAA
ncbi:MAG TPA: caspase family protein [Pyrinomonadaceae bacterium]|nr:caspase family protein [Pyrinomonadaceae bacterium]